MPSCEHRLISGRSPHGLCPHHEELLDFLLFILPRIEAVPGTPKAPGLILPGQPGYAMPLDAIKREMEKGRVKP
ncbi:hypothetical protein ES705_03359 [subsurface metagenome]